jgi:hypothetical protein
VEYNRERMWGTKRGLGRDEVKQVETSYRAEKEGEQCKRIVGGQKDVGESNTRDDKIEKSREAKKGDWR